MQYIKYLGKTFLVLIVDSFSPLVHLIILFSNKMLPFLPIVKPLHFGSLLVADAVVLLYLKILPNNSNSLIETSNTIQPYWCFVLFCFVPSPTLQFAGIGGCGRPSSCNCACVCVCPLKIERKEEGALLHCVFSSTFLTHLQNGPRA